MHTNIEKKVHTKGRPPWYDGDGKLQKKPYLIGICGGSASGKTTVAQKITEKMEMPWVTVVSMDSFYKVFNEEQHKRIADQDYNFDHPDAFDFDLIYQTLLRLLDGKSAEVPVYDFANDRRDKNPKLVYGADIIIFEGILSFHRPEIANLMNLKVFVHTDSDICLARRIKRDISKRGRDVIEVLEQYEKFVKPAFDVFIAPEMKDADIIIPRGGENHIAIDIIVRHIKNELVERGYDSDKNDQCYLECSRSHFDDDSKCRPDSLHIVDKTIQIQYIHTIIRNKETSQDDFLLYANELMRLLIRDALNFLPHEKVEAQASNQHERQDYPNICGVSIIRAGDTLALFKTLQSEIRNCKVGELMIKTSEQRMVPELYYVSLPKDIIQCKVLLMDATVATAIREWSKRYAGQTEVLKVCSYFDAQWILSRLNGWFEGYSNNFSHNNGLESQDMLQKKITFRKKLGLSDNLGTIKSTMNLWIIRSEEQIVSMRPTVTSALFRDAFLFKTRGRPMKQVEGSDIYILQISNCDADELEVIYVQLLTKKFNDWDRYKVIKERLCIVQPSSAWKDFYSCSCFEGVKKRLCPHAVMVMCKKAIPNYPPDAISINLEQKRKTERPKLAGAALTMN